ncbi:MAG: hypothetical protein QNJ47_05690 [Nostocaceae cyanobacterium]|nr:hypothetical protein [Nostocaceae cyanobacterium]
MNFELFQRVALNRDLPEHQLKKGDVATLIDFIPHPHNNLSQNSRLTHRPRF